MKPLILSSLSKWKYLIAAIVIGIIVLMYFFSGCGNANSVKKNTVSAVSIIENTTKPIDDSLRKVVLVLRESISSLKRLLVVANNNQQSAKQKGLSTIAVREKAKEVHDTVTSNKACDELENDYRNYAASVSLTDSIQNATISNQDEIIRNQNLDLSIQKNNFEQLKIVDAGKDKELQDTQKSQQKNERKLHGSKFLNKALAIIVVVETAIILLLK